MELVKKLRSIFAHKKPHKKLALINLADYPKHQYSVYWEIRIDPGSWQWGVRFYDRKTGKVVTGTVGGAASEEDARRRSQTWVRNNIEAYCIQ